MESSALVEGGCLRTVESLVYSVIKDSWQVYRESVGSAGGAGGEESY